MRAILRLLLACIAVAVWTEGAWAQAALYFVHPDHLNTPRLVANAAGTAVWKWDQQEPFGDGVADENPSGLGLFDLPLRFPGQRYDTETALHYNYLREYDPSHGRYAESDPIGLAGGVNTFAYAGTRPLMRYDTLGLYNVIDVPPSELNPYQRAQFNKMVAVLQNLGAHFQARINQACFVDRPKLQALFDQWVVGVDPKVFSLIRNRSDYADTSPTAPVTTFYSQFFSQGDAYSSPSDPGRSFIFAHEFRHLSGPNRSLNNGTTNIKNRLLGQDAKDPAEDDADAFARLFTTTCPCGVSK